MKSSLLAKRVISFLQGAKVKKNDRLLLGLSGGCDSLALLYLLIECQKVIPFELHLAHIDHNWQSKSCDEAKALEERAQALKLPFHLHTLDEVPKNDRENWAREKRLAFFKEVKKRYPYRALLLAHHSDDQAETVLKRLGEGAGLRGLGGLIAEKMLNGLLIYRPLIKTRKRELIAYLKERSKEPFWDPSNQDPTFLRARMRETIFPAFERSFGKQVATHFSAFGELWQEVQRYLDEKSCPLKERMVHSAFGTYLKIEPSDDPLELKWVVLSYAEERGVTLTRSASTLLIDLIQRRASNARVEAKPLSFIINGPYLFITSAPFPLQNEQNLEVVKGHERAGWEMFWLGKIKAPEPYDQVITLKQLPKGLKKKMCDWFRIARVPPFLRDKAPLFVREGVLVGDCLTGKELKCELKQCLRLDSF